MKSITVLLLRIFTLAYLILINVSSLGRSDYEISESFKCARFFSYFEKKHDIPADTLHSISLIESGKPHSKYKIKVVWPWTVNVEGKGYYFDTKREAVKFVKTNLMSGKNSIDVGCMQINLKYHPEAFRTVEQAFDPKYNIAYSAKILRDKYDNTGNWLSAIAGYHSASFVRGYKYKKNVIKVANNMKEYRSKLNFYHVNNSNKKYDDVYKKNQRYLFFRTSMKPNIIN